MELNRVYELCVNKGSQQYAVDYFFTVDKINDTSPSPGEIWLVIAVRGDEEHHCCVPKSLSFIRQPEEIVAIIVRREALVLIENSTCPIPLHANVDPDL